MAQNSQGKISRILYAVYVRQRLVLPSVLLHAVNENIYVWKIPVKYNWQIGA